MVVGYWTWAHAEIVHTQTHWGIFPVKKPSIFKKIEKEITSKKSDNLPQKKPILKPKTTEKKNVKKKKKIKKEKI